MRRRIRRALMALANGCDKIGHTGYELFWGMQHNLETPEQLDEDMKRLSSLITSPPNEPDEQVAFSPTTGIGLDWASPEMRNEYAVKFASRKYTEYAVRDETTTGERCYMAYVVELPGCVSDGKTVGEAFANLQLAKVDFIRSLLDDGLEVPSPQTLVFNGKSAVIYLSVGEK